MSRNRTKNKVSKVSEVTPAGTGDDAVHWIDASTGRLPVKGLAWFDENGGSFSRLPLRAQPKVREAVWNLAQCPAGGSLAFRSNTADLIVRVRLPHTDFLSDMAPPGVAGLELYCGTPGRMRSWTVAVPELKDPCYERKLFGGLPRQMREFRLYLPLYCPLASLHIGLTRGARVLAPSAPDVPRPVVFYGTSITQGGCADSPGADAISMIGRRLNVETINLGFSGNGWGERELAELCAEVESSLFVLAYSENVTAESLEQTLPVFVATLRARQPQAPILLVTNLLFTGSQFDPQTLNTLERRRDAVIAFYVARRRAGDGRIHLADGFGLLGDDDGLFTDGVHPTSHGFSQMAERLAPLIRRIVCGPGRD